MKMNILEKSLFSISHKFLYFSLFLHFFYFCISSIYVFLINFVFCFSLFWCLNFVSSSNSLFRFFLSLSQSVGISFSSSFSFSFSLYHCQYSILYDVLNNLILYLITWYYALECIITECDIDNNVWYSILFNYNIFISTIKQHSCGLPRKVTQILSNYY